MILLIQDGRANVRDGFRVVGGFEASVVDL